MPNLTEVPRSTLLLAAGASSRFGGSPKALLRFGQEYALERIARTARETGFGPVIAVVGAHAGEIEQALRASTSAPDRFVVNADWAAGRTGSVQAGLREVEPASAVLLWPVDCPLASPSSLAALQERWRSDALGLWFLPTFEGHGGHPVLFSHEVRKRIFSLAPSESLRTLLPGLGPQVVRVPVSDPGVTVNLNTPAQYEQAVRTHNRAGEQWTER